jgi:hypothetical protein
VSDLFSPKNELTPIKSSKEEHVDPEVSFGHKGAAIFPDLPVGPRTCGSAIAAMCRGRTISRYLADCIELQFEQ